MLKKSLNKEIFSLLKNYCRVVLEGENVKLLR